MLPMIQDAYFSHLQSIHMAADLLYKEIPTHKKKTHKKYYNAVIDRIHLLSHIIDQQNL